MLTLMKEPEGNASTFNKIADEKRTLQKFRKTWSVSPGNSFGSSDVHPHFHFKQRIKIFVLSILPVLEVMLRCSDFLEVC